MKAITKHLTEQRLIRGKKTNAIVDLVTRDVYETFERENFLNLLHNEWGVVRRSCDNEVVTCQGRLKLIVENNHFL